MSAIGLQSCGSRAHGEMLAMHFHLQSEGTSARVWKWGDSSGWGKPGLTAHLLVEIKGLSSFFSPSHYFWLFSHLRGNSRSVKPQGNRPHQISWKGEISWSFWFPVSYLGWRFTRAKWSWQKWQWEVLQREVPGFITSGETWMRLPQGLARSVPLILTSLVCFRPHHDEKSTSRKDEANLNAMFS